MVDSHIHLYSEEFEKDLEILIQAAFDAGVKQFFLPAVDSESHEAMISLEKRYPDHCFAMMGLHPVYVKENYKEELKLVEEWLEKRKFVAVGEIGIDLYWDETFREQQMEAFHTQIGWALKYGYPIVIHCRDKKGSWEAMDQAIEIVEGYKDQELKGIFHCFSGLAGHAKRIADTGFYLGIGGVLTYKNSGLTEAIAEVPLNRVVLETDGPYLAP
ncbi:MAG: TatD family hydrolase, partial [Flavitalea sp.]